MCVVCVFACAHICMGLYRPEDNLSHSSGGADHLGFLFVCLFPFLLIFEGRVSHWPGAC